ncbi:MAG TPA: trigger factor [Soehngenia sp.]|nr:trigger factor [Soehngenia sp.]HPP31735.1 trigger factor [Soehngenia sp.]
MKVDYVKKEKNTVYFDAQFTPEEFEEAVQKAYIANRSRFNIPGFRKGKAPRQLIELNYGKEIFYEDAINDLLPEAYSHAIDEFKLEPVDRPDVDIEDIEKDKPIIAKFSVEVKPEVKLGDYSNLEIEKTDYSVTDEMINAELERVRDMNARIIDAGDREIVDKDILTIDFEGYIDGEPFEGGSAKDQTLEIGSGQFIPGFEEGLIGKKKGEEVEINVKFPEDYFEESLRGKDATFKVTIKEVKYKELPELDDEFAMDVSEFETLEEYKNSIKVELEKSLKEQENIDLENKIVEKLVEISEFEIPDAMIESQIDSELDNFDYRMKMQGFSLEKYLELTNMSIDQMRESFREVAKKKVEAQLVLEAVAKNEKIEATDEDIQKELEKIAESYSPDNKEKFIEDMKKGDLNFLKEGIINDKVLDFLKERVKYVQMEG